MTGAARLNGRITKLAVGRHLSYRAVRARLTLIYGALFLLSGAALMAIAYALLVNAGFVFTLQSSPGPQRVVHVQPRFATVPTHPSAQTLAHWRNVARCMRAHGVAAFPDPRTSVPRGPIGAAEISDRDGAILVIPATLNVQSRTFTHAAVSCGFLAQAPGAPTPTDSRRTSHVKRELVLQSGIALAGMSILSLALGWLMAGRVLQPLEDAYEAQRQFVANASHELRTPLARQRALIQVALADPDASAASLREAHERVLASEQGMAEMVDALLTLTRGRAGLERREPLDVATVAEAALRARRAEAEAAGLHITATLGPAPTTGDGRLLDRLIANLLDNAIRHNIPGGRVELATGTRDRAAFISVTNTGPAIPQDQIQRLFEPFQRLTGNRTQHATGHGLGLAIVQAIANAHGAELTTDANPQGGLTIEVSFPHGTGARLEDPADARAHQSWIVPSRSRLTGR